MIALVRILVLALALPLAAHADGNEGKLKYRKAYTLIEQAADAENHGKLEKARSLYIESRDLLEEVKEEYNGTIRYDRTIRDLTRHIDKLERILDNR